MLKHDLTHLPGCCAPKSRSSQHSPELGLGTTTLSTRAMPHLCCRVQGTSTQSPVGLVCTFPVLGQSLSPGRHAVIIYFKKLFSFSAQ